VGLEAFDSFWSNIGSQKLDKKKNMESFLYLMKQV